MGLSIGFVWGRRIVRFKAGGQWFQRLGAYLLGLAIMFCIYFGLKGVFAHLPPLAPWRFIRYGLVGFWGGLRRALAVCEAEAPARRK